MSKKIIKFARRLITGLFLITLMASCTLIQPDIEEVYVGKQFPSEKIVSIDLPDMTSIGQRQIAYCYYDQNKDPVDTYQQPKIFTLDTSSIYDIKQSFWTSAFGVDSGCGHGLEWLPEGNELLLGVGGDNGLVLVGITPEGNQVSENEFFDLPQYTYYIVWGKLAWSPTGEWVAFVGEHSRAFPSVYVASKDGTEVKQLTESSTLPGVTSEPVWSHDGTKIAYAMPYPDNGIGIIDVESGIVTSFNQDNVSQFPPGVRDVHGLMPKHSIAWLPGDNLILFLTNSESADADILWVMAPDGSNLMQLYEGPIQQIELSPDGKKLAVVLTDKKQSKILLMHLEQNLRTETILDSTNWALAANETTNFQNLDWSPDGSQLAFSANPQGNYDIFLWEQESGRVDLLLGSPADETMPLWRPPQMSN